MNITQIIPFIGPVLEGMGRGFGLVRFAGFIGVLLLTVLIAWILIRLLRHGRVGPVHYQPTSRPAPPSPEDAARTRLAERLANGEISPEEYLERVAALRPPVEPTDI